MSKGLFITATGTDIGKTYVTALIVKKLRQSGLNAGYYKAALSGADCVEGSDAGYVNRVAGIGQDEDTLVSYLYKNALSPHLAARLEGNPPELSRIAADYRKVQARYDYVTVEGSGGIVCPIRWDEKHILLEDVVKELGLGALIVADAGLGTINATVLTAEYLARRSVAVRGIVLNRYTGGVMQEDNRRMIEQLTRIPVVAVVAPNAENLNIDADALTALYD